MRLKTYSEGTCVLILPGVSHVLKFEKLAQEKSVQMALIPTPREISSDCGMAVLFHRGELESIKQLLHEISWEKEGKFFCKP